MKLSDKVAFVTGAGRGIGKSIALRLAEDGAAVILAGTSPEPLQDVADQVRALGGRALAIQTDVSHFHSVQNAIDKSCSEFGEIDILVNNAGGSARGRMSLFCNSTEDTWDHIINTNLKGVMYTCRALINSMQERGSGSIINIASVAGMIGIPAQADYSAAKGAVIAFSQALAKETAAHGVRVNCVSPGPVRSDAGRTIPDAMKKSLAYQQLADATGLGRFADPDDIANLVAFLAAEEAKFITGQNYPVCGVMNLGLANNILG